MPKHPRSPAVDTLLVRRLRKLAGISALAALSLAQAAEPPAPPRPACPNAGAEVVERFISADCADCWGQRPPGPAASDAPRWWFDWIVTTTAGDEAPLSSAAIADGNERVARTSAGALTGSQMLVQRATLPPLPGLHLSVQSGPAWSGYLGLQLTLRGRAPAGSSGWLALVERLPAGSEGSPVERHLLRAVAGPLPLDAKGRRPLTHLRAMRWPATADPARLEARAWIEATDGRLLAVADARCGAAAPRP